MLAKELINMMEIALRKRLEVTKERLKEIDDFLMRPDAANDLNKFKELNVERAQLEPVVEKYNEFLQAESDQADAQIMSNDDDVQIAEFGKEESKRLIEVQEKIIDELKILLIPKDPNDEKILLLKLEEQLEEMKQTFLLEISLGCMQDMQKIIIGKFK